MYVCMYVSMYGKRNTYRVLVYIFVNEWTEERQERVGCVPVTQIQYKATSVYGVYVCIYRFL